MWHVDEVVCPQQEPPPGRRRVTRAQQARSYPPEWLLRPQAHGPRVWALAGQPGNDLICDVPPIQRGDVSGVDGMEQVASGERSRPAGPQRGIGQRATRSGVEFDAGQQTRLFHFSGQAPANEPDSLQGYSVASWDGPPPGRGARGPMRAGALKVVTTHLKPGYLRKNGVPYSEKTVLTEYYSRANEDDGTSYLIVTTVVDDPTYLTQPFITSTHFRLEPNGSKWMPSACEAK